MRAEAFIECMEALGVDFYTGVPDSQLKALVNCLYDTCGVCEKHMVAANEGNAAALAAGHYLATGRLSLVYLQNSGLGNLVNPYASLLHRAVYEIPCVFVVGWRGRPGVHDEPQHVFQGENTLPLLETLGIPRFVLESGTGEAELRDDLAAAAAHLKEKRSVAFVVGKDAFTYDKAVKFQNANTLTREEAIGAVCRAGAGDVFVSTTGKASRELYEERDRTGAGHDSDFLTVGSMGHSSSVALKIALDKPETRVWCIDGDGAALMHLGAMAVIGSRRPGNFKHIVMNNGAHESVGGIPTVAGGIDFLQLAPSLGYEAAYRAGTPEELAAALAAVRDNGKLSLIEVKVKIGSRPELGRPKTTPTENKEAFMRFLDGK